MSDQSRRAYRGGSWHYVASLARVALRYHLPPRPRRLDYLGFRLAEEVEEAKRVNRGGCWGSAPAFARVAYRGGITPSSRGSNLGFRLVENEATKCDLSGGEGAAQWVVGHVFRGGRWSNSPTYARGAYSLWTIPSYRYDYLGVRLAVEQNTPHTPE